MCRKFFDFNTVHVFESHPLRHNKSFIINMIQARSIFACAIRA